MKKLLTAIIVASGISTMACDFQATQVDYVKAKKIKCNERSETATIKMPKIEIDGKFRNITGLYGVEVSYWDRSTSRSRSSNSYRNVDSGRRRTKIEGRQISSRSANALCQLFGFHYAVSFETAKIFSYLKKAYSMDHNESFLQNIHHAPMSKITCR